MQTTKKLGSEWVSALLVAALPGLIAAAPPAQARPYTADDQVRLARVSDPALSPDGRSVAYQLRQTDYDANKGANGIWLVDAQAAGATPRRLTPEALNATGPQWSPDGSHVYFMAPKDGVQQVWRVAAGGASGNASGAAEPQAVTAYALDVGSFLPSPDRRHLAVSLEVYPDCDTLACSRQRLDAAEASRENAFVYTQLFVRHWDTWKDGRRSQLFIALLDDGGTAAGEPRHIAFDGDVPSKPFGDATEWAFTPDGRDIVFAARAGDASESWSTNFDLWRTAIDGTRAPINLTAANPALDTGPLFSADGKVLYYRAMKRAGFESDRLAIMALDLAAGTAKEVAPAWDRSADALALSEDGRTLYTVADDLGQHPLFAIEVAGGKVKKLTGPGRVEGFDIGARRIVYAEDSLSGPADLFSIAPAGGRAQRLTSVNAERLKGVEFGAYEQFQFAGAGGDTVHGYVVKPVGFRAGTRYPVAFIVHGGPQGSMANDFHYRWNPQTYAGAGYAVVFIDFHGSTGYGQAFTDAISRDWGGKPLEDLQKGWAAALAKYPFLDGERACALGASYGGFMMNWIAGNWPDGFRCLVNHDGIFDQRSMYYSTEELWFVEWEQGGPQYDAAESYERHNPINHVAKWRTPMLVIHGGADYRVPLEQGLATFTALQRRGIPSALLHLPDENHWVLKPQNSVRWHREIEAWLRQWTADGSQN